MSAMKMLPALALLVAATPTLAAGPAGKNDVVAFKATVRVEVDAAGKPVKVEAPADLPEAIRAFVEKRVASWDYAPARQDGTPVPAVTYVKVGACAVPLPDGKGFSLGVDFKGNGPKLAHAAERLPPPYYPDEARRRGAEGTFKVSYTIQPDGSARLDAIEPLEGGNWALKQLRGALTDWVGQLRYQPEQVNGQAVATRMSMPVEFRLGNGGGTPRWLADYRQQLQQRVIASSECKLASGEDMAPMPLAQDSPVKVTPRPAG